MGVIGCHLTCPPVGYLTTDVEGLVHHYSSFPPPRGTRVIDGGSLGLQCCDGIGFLVCFWDCRGRGNAGNVELVRRTRKKCSAPACSHYDHTSSTKRSEEPTTYAAIKLECRMQSHATRGMLTRYFSVSADIWKLGRAKSICIRLRYLYSNLFLGAPQTKELVAT